MQLNLNVTLSIIFDGKKTDKEQEAALVALEGTIERLQAKFGISPSFSPVVVSNELLERNKAYLTANGRQRTPRVSMAETAIRAKHGDALASVNMQDVQARHEALLDLGLDIFAKQAGASSDDMQGETSTEDINPDEVIA